MIDSLNDFTITYTCESCNKVYTVTPELLEKYFDESHPRPSRATTYVLYCAHCYHAHDINSEVYNELLN